MPEKRVEIRLADRLVGQGDSLCVESGVGVTDLLHGWPIGDRQQCGRADFAIGCDWPKELVVLWQCQWRQNESGFAFDLGECSST